MVGEAVAKFFDLLFRKIAPYPLFVLCGFSALLLFGRNALISFFHLQHFKEAWGDDAGPVFVVSSLYWLAYGIDFLCRGVVNYYSLYRQKQWIRRRLKQLTEGEKIVLRQFFRLKSRTMEVPMEGLDIIALKDAGLIYYPPQAVHAALDWNQRSGLTYPVKAHINDYVWEILQANPALLR
jgi:hypothetical protein